MDSRIVSTLGLILGIIGVAIVFMWGPPQPTLTPGVSLALADATSIDEDGKTVADYNREVAERRKTYACMSRFGLILIMVGFVLQLLAVWLPIKGNRQFQEAVPTEISAEAKQKSPNRSNPAAELDLPQKPDNQ